MADSIVQHAPNTLPGLAAGTVDDCWRRIGTGGDRSCPRLQDCLRCRNCPVYAQAAVTVLDSLSAGSLQDSVTDNAVADAARIDRAAGEPGSRAIAARHRGQRRGLDRRRRAARRRGTRGRGGAAVGTALAGV